MNQYLDPPASADEQADLLTRAGFPMESREDIALPDGTIDQRQDIELTSNRGDCLSHLGLAREIAAMSQRRFAPPTLPASIKATGPNASSIASVENQRPDLCPLYTARVIRGVKVGPSPTWLADRLLARGDIPRNAIVDASNFVLFEYGQPTHVFDLNTLRGKRIVVRMAAENEPFLPIGEGAAEIKLNQQDLVIADAERAVAMAGVKGGALTAVTATTTDILIEAATFAPAAVRAASRRHGIASDSSYRFERGVHAGQIEAAADRLTALILELCGGELCNGVLAVGAAIPSMRRVTMRCERCRAILGVAVSDDRMNQALDRLGFQPSCKGGVIECTIPHQRLDVEREIDLIEEVGRMVGLESVPIIDAIQVRVAAPQSEDQVRRAVIDALVGMGYVETVTHSLIPESAAAPFLMPGMEAMRVADQRAAAAPILRPSVLPSLLRVLAFNRDNSVRDVKLFESASTFARINGQPTERVNLAMLCPAPAETAVRELRGVIDRLVQLVLGNAIIDVEPTSAATWLTPGAVIRVNGEILGLLGMVAAHVVKEFGLSEPIAAAEIGLPAHYRSYPPETSASALPMFPAIERDVSAIVEATLPWMKVRQSLEALRLGDLEAIEFITTFRGKQVGAGRKSLTLRARFRAHDRTLTHAEVDQRMDVIMRELRNRFAAEIRS